MVDQHLKDISEHVHESLKRLKMGDSGVVPITKDFKAEELTRYIQAYAMHKTKWFDLEHDETANVLRATRVTPPPWDIPDEEDTEEEE
jgi:hypothetical protein